jgi:hypothetical protein
MQWVEDIDLEWQGYQFDWPRPLVSTEVSLRSYMDLVDAYSQRSLSHESDMQCFRWYLWRCSRGGFVGLALHCVRAVSHLGAWCSGKASCCRREQLSWIPSWSWFAWRGHICLGRGSLDATRTPEIVLPMG